MDHRNHLVNVIKKKTLKKRSKKPPVSFLPQGELTFKVGYTGKIQDIYAANPNLNLI